MLHSPVEASACESPLGFEPVEEARVSLLGGCVVPQGAESGEDPPSVDRHLEVIAAFLLRPGPLPPCGVLCRASKLPGLSAGDSRFFEQEQALLGVDDATHQLLCCFWRLSAD